MFHCLKKVEKGSEKIREIYSGRRGGGGEVIRAKGERIRISARFLSFIHQLLSQETNM